MPAADVGDPRAALELGDDAVERRQPARRPGWRRSSGRKKRSQPSWTSGLCSCQPRPSPSRGRSMIRGGVADGAERDLEEAGQVRRAGLVGERDGVLRRQRVAARRRRRTSTNAPAAWALSHSRAYCSPVSVASASSAAVSGPPLGQRPVVAEPVAHHDERGVEGGADLVDGAEDEGHQRGLVELGGRAGRSGGLGGHAGDSSVRGGPGRAPGPLPRPSARGVTASHPVTPLVLGRWHLGSLDSGHAGRACPAQRDVEALLAGARLGQSGVLVVARRGRDRQERAARGRRRRGRTGLRLLRARGTEAERELPFAGLASAAAARARPGRDACRRRRRRRSASRWRCARATPPTGSRSRRACSGC